MRAAQDAPGPRRGARQRVASRHAPWLLGWLVLGAFAAGALAAAQALQRILPLP